MPRGENIMITMIKLKKSCVPKNMNPGIYKLKCVLQKFEQQRYEQQTHRNQYSAKSHGKRFRIWFDSEFNLSSMDNKSNR